MGVFDVIKLIGACVAFIVGTIVFMVFFFRGMSWIDIWVTGRREIDEKRRKARRAKDTKHALRIQEQQALALEVRKPLPAKDPFARRQENTPNSATSLPWSNGIGSVHISKRTSMPPVSQPDAVADQLESGSGKALKAMSSQPESSAASGGAKAEAGRSSKAVSRIATVHLLSGETIERVAFCPKDKASKICEGLGFEGIVLEDSEGHICVVRESNIKMVTWKAE